MITKIWFGFHYQIPTKERAIQTFQDQPQPWWFPDDLVRLGNKSPSVTNTRRSSVKCLSWRSSGSLKSEAQISLWKLEFEWSLEERGWERKRASQSVCNVYWVSCRAREAWGAFYSPLRESSRWSVRNPDMSGQPLWNPAWGPDMSGLGLSHWENLVRSDMSGLGAGHVRPTSLEFGLEAGYVWPDRSFWW
jgi:hypothetical protein